MMIIRPYEISDTEAINEIYDKFHSGSFSIPPIEQNRISATVTNDDTKVIAFGAITLLAESVLVIDLDASIREKNFAIQQLLWTAIQGVTNLHMDGLHAFIQDPEFAKVLKKHFGFKTCKGEALYLGV